MPDEIPRGWAIRSTRARGPARAARAAAGDRAGSAAPAPEPTRSARRESPRALARSPFSRKISPGEAIDPPLACDASTHRARPGDLLPRGAEGAGSHARVLVVEDEKTFRELLERHLARRGYEVVAVGSAEEALARAPELDPDVALLDLALPGMSGIECLKEAARGAPRARGDHPHGPRQRRVGDRGHEGRAPSTTSPSRSSSPSWRSTSRMRSRNADSREKTATSRTSWRAPGRARASRS